MNWQTIDSYPKPAQVWDLDRSEALFYSPENGITIGYCVLMDDDDREYRFYHGDAWRFKPTHWMPLPSVPTSTTPCNVGVLIDTYADMDD